MDWYIYIYIYIYTQVYIYFFCVLPVCVVLACRPAFGYHSKDEVHESFAWLSVTAVCVDNGWACWGSFRAKGGSNISCFYVSIFVDFNTFQPANVRSDVEVVDHVVGICRQLSVRSIRGQQYFHKRIVESWGPPGWNIHVSYLQCSHDVVV